MSIGSTLRWLAGISSLCFGLMVSAPVYSAPAIDGGFGAAGTVRIGTSWGYEDNPSASAMQADGKILVAGARRNRSAEPYVMRFASEGVLDTSFGEGGVRLLDPNSGIDLSAFEGGTLAQMEALGDGSILLRGDRVIARLNAQGAVDTGFGSNGYYTADQDVLGFIPQPDGRILLVGMSANRTGDLSFPPVLTRLTAQGQPDLAFGSGGWKVLNGLPPNFTINYAQPLVARPDGSLVLNARATFQEGTFLLIGITPAGELDQSFGGGGWVSGYDLGVPTEFPNSFALAADGGLWLYHYGDNAPGVFLRLARNGTRDPNFGQGGRRVLDSCCFPRDRVLMRAHGDGMALVEQSLYPASTATGTAASQGYLYDRSGALVSRWPGGSGGALAVEGYARLVVWGLFAPPGGGLLLAAEADISVFCRFSCMASGIDVALLAFDSAGRWQSGFGRGDGVAILNTPAISRDWIDTLLVEPDGKILMGGFTYRSFQEFLVARVDATGAPDNGFGQSGRYVPAPYEYAHFTGLARLARGPDGRLAVAAGVAYGSWGGVAGVSAFRLSNQGATLGGFTPALTAPNYANADIALAAAPSGRIYYAQGGTLEARLPDGSPDASFGNGGKLVVPLPEIATGQADPTSHAALVVTADGGVALALSTLNGPWIYRFDASGSAVAGFGEGGVYRYAKPRPPVYGLAVPQIWIFGLPDGGLLLGYHGSFFTDAVASNAEEFQFVVLRVSAEGRLIHAKTFSDGPNWSNWQIRALPDGSAAITHGSALYRMFADGSFDLSFGPGGAFTLPLTHVDTLGVDRAGRLLIAGQDATSALVQRYRLDANVGSVPVVEFFNGPLNHYFVTGGPGEIAAIEAGAAGAGWGRTGLGFRAYAPESGVPLGALPVCRFYGTPGVGPNSHFYTVDPIECELVKRDRGWSYEGTAFYVFPPANGQCAASQQPVYRVYNMRFAQNDSNHRYTTEAAVYAQMQAQGWAGEGVKLCGAN